jgi:hypothetical protein
MTAGPRPPQDRPMSAAPPPALCRRYTGSVAADLSIGALLLIWLFGAPGSLIAALSASPWFGAPVIGLSVALWTERNIAAAAFGAALMLSLLGNGYLLTLAAG